MQTLSEIVSQIKQAVKIAGSTPNEPEKKLREIVSPIWESFLKEKRIGLNLQIRDELTLANGRADNDFNVYLRIIRLFAVKVIDHRGNEVMVVREIE